MKTVTAKKKRPDKYDRAIAWLKKRPEMIVEAWTYPSPYDPDEVKQAHCLFQCVSHTGETVPGLGCLTQVRSGWVHAPNDELTTAIRADESIPASVDAIELKHLPAFARWQRRLDRTIRRKKARAAK